MKKLMTTTAACAFMLAATAGVAFAGGMNDSASYPENHATKSHSTITPGTSEDMMGRSATEGGAPGANAAREGDTYAGPGKKSRVPEINQAPTGGTSSGQ
jgi:hypothetical protein